MLEEKLREVLALEKEQQLRLNRAQLEAEEIKKQAQLEAKRYLEQGKAEFLKQIDSQRAQLLEELERFEKEFFTKHRGDVERLKQIYDSAKDRLAQELANWLAERI